MNEDATADKVRPAVLVSVAVQRLESAVAGYTALLGHAPIASSVARALFGLENAWLELREHPAATGLRALAFGVDDLSARAAQLGIVGEVEHDFGLRRSALTHGTRGLSIGVFDRSEGRSLRARAAEQAALHALDHVVIRTSDCEAAIALFGGRLGFRLALDRMLGPSRMLFFRTAGVTIEVVHDARLGAEDSLYGLAYRARDLASAHARVAAQGASIDAIRDGRKPGTRVFTVRDGTCDVPTLVLHDASRA